MKVRIITASAGSGKTTRLSQVLDEAIAGGTVRPDGIVATTFTKQAAAELIERARGRLLESGRGRQAHQLLAARIGTVNSVCGSLVTDYAFELGLSPRLRILDETAAEIEQKRVLAQVVAPDVADRLQSTKHRFDSSFDWHYEVRRLIEAARANGLGAETLRACAARSVESLDACLGPCAKDGDAIDLALMTAIDQALGSIDTDADATVGTGKYIVLLRSCRRDLERGRLRWGEWAKLGKAEPTKASKAAAAPIHAAAAGHLGHPRLREEMHELIELMYTVAADALTAYQEHKRERGVIDFGDQETLALELLRRPDVRADLEGQLDLVLVDEFQDTSPLQLAIFLELAQLARESVWVGDPKQAIYGFRGTDPALMDAAIESLTSTTSDPELIQQTVEALAKAGTLETLSVSYRSRPELVELTSDIFARAFAHQDLPEERTRLTPHLTDEPAGLGPTVEHWPLCPEGRGNKETLAACAAAGVRDVLASGNKVRDRPSGAVRLATARDLAVLCRTNEQCQLIAEALADLGIAAVVPRMGLFESAEGRMVLAGLRLWIDPRDALAQALLARYSEYAGDLGGLVARALAEPGRAFGELDVVKALVTARESALDLDPVGALAAIIDATDLRERCASWGRASLRLANLDAVRAHAVAYVAEAEAGRDAATVTGLLQYLVAMTESWGWGPGSSRTDKQALLGGEDAVTVSTWHRSKGLEWPITVLYGLESLRPPLAYGVHVTSDQQSFDVAAPLAGRWVRFWPNPYSTSNQGGPVKDAYEQSDAFTEIRDRARREALRVLYVGWTRARDRLVLAAHQGKLTAGLLGALVAPEPLLSDPGIAEPTDTVVTWADRSVALRIRPAVAAEPVATLASAGEVTVGRPPTIYPPARLSPSAAPAIDCKLGEPIELGPRLPLRGSPDMARLGDAVHGFYAADRPSLAEPARLAIARGLLDRFGVAAHLDAADLVASATRLWTWLDTAGATRIHREWPLALRDPHGTLITGTADLVADTEPGYLVLDHKSFRGTTEVATERAATFTGQLRLYADAIERATGRPVTGLALHLPVLGLLLPMQP